MTTEERDKLVVELEDQSEDITQEFGYLYACTRKCLENGEITAVELKDFFEGCGLGELADKIDSTDSVSDVMRKVNRGGYWTFFNYKLLESIINKYCRINETLCELMTAYAAKFRDYCKRRVYEVPADVIKCATISSVNPASVLCLKLDETFKLSDSLIKVKKLQNKIEKLLNIEHLYLVDVKDGCIEITFRYFKEFKEVFPLCEHQIGELTQIGVEKLQCDSYAVSLKDNSGKTIIS